MADFQKRKQRPIWEYAKDVLEEHPDGLRIKDIANKILEAGYVTNSKDFYQTVGSELRRLVPDIFYQSTHDERM